MANEVMKKKIATDWDVVDYLETEEDQIGYLNVAFEHGDIEMILVCLGDVARAKGMTAVSKETGITRDGLYKALSATGNPSLGLIQKVLNSFGLQLTVKKIGSWFSSLG